MTVELITTIIALVTAITNIYWIIQLKSVQGNGEIIKNLKERLKEKEETIKELEHFKVQYYQKHTDNRALEGIISVYRKLHKHDD